MVDSIVVAVGDRKALLAGMASHVPTSRVCTADDVANAELFRASDEAAMINGSGLLADGAQLAGLSPDHLPH